MRLFVRGQVLCKYKSQYSLIYIILILRQEITKGHVFATRITAKNRTTLSRIFCNKKLVQKSEVYVNSTHQGYSLVSG